MTAVTSELATVEANETVSVSSALDAIRGGSSNLAHTLGEATWETRVALFEAVSNSEKIDDHKNETIYLANVVAQEIELLDENTKELVQTTRVTLIDADGKALSAISNGLIRSIENLFGIMGQPNTWPAPLPVKVIEVKGRGPNKFFSLIIDTDAMSGTKKK